MLTSEKITDNQLARRIQSKSVPGLGTEHAMGVWGAAPKLNFFSSNFGEKTVFALNLLITGSKCVFKDFYEKKSKKFVEIFFRFFFFSSLRIFRNLCFPSLCPTYKLSAAAP